MGHSSSPDPTRFKHVNETIKPKATIIDFMSHRIGLAPKKQTLGARICWCEFAPQGNAKDDIIPGDFVCVSNALALQQLEFCCC